MKKKQTGKETEGKVDSERKWYDKVDGDDDCEDNNTDYVGAPVSQLAATYKDRCVMISRKGGMALCNPIIRSRDH